jgi:hypothetical protein
MRSLGIVGGLLKPAAEYHSGEEIAMKSRGAGRDDPAAVDKSMVASGGEADGGYEMARLVVKTRAFWRWLLTAVSLKRDLPVDPRIAIRGLCEGDRYNDLAISKACCRNV